MASEIRVDKINSLSGVGTVTLSPTGVDICGITTAATLKATTGIVTTLTATTGIVTTFVTNTANVGGGVTISESGIEASGIGITVANINGGAVGGRRNMIINGDQRIAQRNTTAKLVTTDAAYRCVDRFKTDIDGSGGGNFFHGQTGAGSSITADVPTGQGFTHSSKITVNASVSQPSGTDNRHQFYTMLEKQDVFHLEWGTSAAKTCTLSFWVKSSVAGTYILWIKFYGAADYYYYTNYTINSADTWEKKVITITGHTSGGNVSGTVDQGLLIEWNLGTSSGNETGTLNEWTTTASIRAASGTVYLPENAGATWYITGAQFEVGSQATAFEHRSYGDELALCQRYYFGGAGYSGNSFFGTNYHTTNQMVTIPHPTIMRTTPTVATPTVSGGGTMYTTYTGQLQTQFYVTGDQSNYIAPTEIDISAEL